MSLIKIDGKAYEVGEVSLSRDAELLFDPLTKGTTLDFTAVADAVGTAYSYNLGFEPRDTAQYDEFYYDITAPKSVRTVEIPFGQGTVIFDARIESVSDVLKRAHGKNKWGALRVRFLPVRPQRYPE